MVDDELSAFMGEVREETILMGEMEVVATTPVAPLPAPASLSGVVLGKIIPPPRSTQ